jgi:hypothetical protein
VDDRTIKPSTDQVATTGMSQTGRKNTLNRQQQKRPDSRPHQPLEMTRPHCVSSALTDTRLPGVDDFGTDAS